MALVLVCQGLVYQALLRAGHLSPSEKLLLVVPIVLYNGWGRWTVLRTVGKVLLQSGCTTYVITSRLPWAAIPEVLA